MGTRPTGFNLTIGQNGLSYQDVMCVNDLFAIHFARFDHALRYSIPSARGSHSDRSGQ